MALPFSAVLGKQKSDTGFPCELCCISLATMLDKGGDHNNMPFVSSGLVGTGKICLQAKVNVVPVP